MPFQGDSYEINRSIPDSGDYVLELKGFLSRAHSDVLHGFALIRVAVLQHEHHVRGQHAGAAARLDERQERRRQVEPDLQRSGASQ